MKNLDFNIKCYKWQHLSKVWNFTLSNTHEKTSGEEKIFTWIRLQINSNYSSQALNCVLEKAVAPHSSTLAWKIPWTRSLVGCSPWGRWGSDRTKRLHFHFSLSCIGEGNGNPLQCSCLESPRDGGAWWAAVYGVAQTWTRLKWLSSNCILS